MDLGQLAADYGRSFSHHLRHVGQGRDEPVRRFIKYDDALFSLEASKPGLSLAGFCREKSFKNEAIGRESRGRECCGKSGGAGDGDDPDSLFCRSFYDPVPRIGYARGSGIRDDGDVQPLIQFFKQIIGLELFVVIVIRCHPCSDAIMGEQLARVPGVFGCDKIGLFEGAYGPEGDVFEIPDRGCDNIEGAWCVFWHSKSPNKQELLCKQAVSSPRFDWANLS